MRRLVNFQFVQKVVIAGVVGVGGYAIASATAKPSPSLSTKPTANIHSNSSADVHAESSDDSQPAEEATPQSSSRGSASNTSHTEVTVNGQSIEVPVNGSVNQTITTDGGTANVSVTNQNSSTGEGSNSHRTQLNVHSSSNSSSSVITREKGSYRSSP